MRSAGIGRCIGAALAVPTPRSTTICLQQIKIDAGYSAAVFAGDASRVYVLGDGANTLHPATNDPRCFTACAGMLIRRAPE